MDLSARDEGLLLGLLLTQGSFGGDGRQPHVIVKLHVRHERLLRWLADAVPGSRLYGPYAHGDRRYFQWMARGKALTEHLLPLLRSAGDFDDHAAIRISAMIERYELA